ncbi:hypothetical protein [Alcanivorax sp.]|jgi:predicted cobalt transporter CbtA|uniref:hypothetical protein n=1 Tax=Alcanivorax sp. TaxID=1872427 RepID=UPI0026227D24|nr:hypothetical protein [Alcanivorax sp.]
MKLNPLTGVFTIRKVEPLQPLAGTMKALVWTLLLIICTHVLVLDAMHHEHDADVAVEQLDDAPVQLDVLDGSGDHCCQCHGFMASMECAPARLPAPPATVLASRPPLPDAPADNPFRPPIA